MIYQFRMDKYTIIKLLWVWHYIIIDCTITLENVNGENHCRPSMNVNLIKNTASTLQLVLIQSNSTEWKRLHYVFFLYFFFSPRHISDLVYSNDDQGMVYQNCNVIFVIPWLAEGVKLCIILMTCVNMHQYIAIVLSG